jgi:4-amino-4-deoxy-L-arabinose transferase-like glycosyltransferase
VEVVTSIKQGQAATIAASARNEKLILWLIVLLALGLRLFLMGYSKSYLIENDWAFGYETGRIAKAITVGEGFSSPFRHSSGPTAWLMPLYPLLLAVIFEICGVYTTNAAIATLIVNCFISSLTCILLYHIAKLLFNRNVAYIVAMVFVLYPPSVWHAVNTIWDTTVFTFLAAALIYWLLLLPQRLDFRSAALYGFFMGVVALVNAAIIAFYPFVIIWLFLQSTLDKGRKIKYLATICTLGFVTLMPWAFRNYVVFGRPMLRSNFGLEMKLGNSPQAWNAFKSESDGRARVSPFSLGHPSNTHSEFQRYARLGEMNYMDRCFDEAMAFIKGNPGKCLRLTLKRIFDFWLGELVTTNEWAGNLKVSFLTNLQCHKMLEARYYRALNAV